MVKLEYLFGRGIRNRDAVVALDQKYWLLQPCDRDRYAYTFRDVEDLDRKISRADSGFACAEADGTPAAVLKTMLLKTSGCDGQIPKTHGELTAANSWSSYDAAGNTRVLVTFTVEESMRRLGERSLTDEAMEYFLAHYTDEFLVTYSPATHSAARLHGRHGAKPVMLLRRARPGLVINGEPAEDVIVMGYRWPRYL